MIQRSLLPLLALSASCVLAPALAQDDQPPLDAVGNARISQAPYVQPADHTGRLIATDFTLNRCKVSCPAESIDVMEFREGNTGLVRKVPGRYHAGDVTVCGDKLAMKPLLDWFDTIKSGKPGAPGRDVTLEILAVGSDGKETVTCRFLLRRAWPHQLNWAPDGSVCAQLTVEATEMLAQTSSRLPAPSSRRPASAAGS